MYTGYELLWLFFVYSFLGWALETAAAAVRQKRFVNRGLVNGPICVIYGIAAVLITVFCREVRLYERKSGGKSHRARRVCDANRSNRPQRRKKVWNQ